MQQWVFTRDKKWEVVDITVLVYLDFPAIKFAVASDDPTRAFVYGHTDYEGEMIPVAEFDENYRDPIPADALRQIAGENWRSSEWTQQLIDGTYDPNDKFSPLWSLCLWTWFEWDKAWERTW